MTMSERRSLAIRLANAKGMVPRRVQNFVPEPCPFPVEADLQLAAMLRSRQMTATPIVSISG
jgi:hypothetical protein